MCRFSCRIALAAKHVDGATCKWLTSAQARQTGKVLRRFEPPVLPVAASRMPPPRQGPLLGPVRLASNGCSGRQAALDGQVAVLATNYRPDNSAHRLVDATASTD